VVVASLVAFKLNVPLQILWINYRGANNEPIHSYPQIAQPFTLPQGITSILMVDDVVVSGKTMTAAKAVLSNIKITTLALKGKADIVLFPEISSCIQWPWNPTQST